MEMYNKRRSDIPKSASQLADDVYLSMSYSYSIIFIGIIFMPMILCSI